MSAPNMTSHFSESDPEDSTGTSNLPISSEPSTAQTSAWRPRPGGSGNGTASPSPTADASNFIPDFEEQYNNMVEYMTQDKTGSSASGGSISYSISSNNSFPAREGKYRPSAGDTSNGASATALSDRHSSSSDGGRRSTAIGGGVTGHRKYNAYVPPDSLSTGSDFTAQPSNMETSNMMFDATMCHTPEMYSLISDASLCQTPNYYDMSSDDTTGGGSFAAVEGDQAGTSLMDIVDEWEEAANKDDRWSYGEIERMMTGTMQAFDDTESKQTTAADAYRRSSMGTSDAPDRPDTPQLICMVDDDVSCFPPQAWDGPLIRRNKDVDERYAQDLDYYMQRRLDLAQSAREKSDTASGTVAAFESWAASNPSAFDSDTATADASDAQDIDYNRRPILRRHNPRVQKMQDAQPTRTAVTAFEDTLKKSLMCPGHLY